MQRRPPGTLQTAADAPGPPGPAAACWWRKRCAATAARGQHPTPAGVGRWRSTQGDLAGTGPNGCQQPAEHHLAGPAGNTFAAVLACWLGGQGNEARPAAAVTVAAAAAASRYSASRRPWNVSLVIVHGGSATQQNYQKQVTEPSVPAMRCWRVHNAATCKNNDRGVRFRIKSRAPSMGHPAQKHWLPTRRRMPGTCCMWQPCSSVAALHNGRRKRKIPKYMAQRHFMGKNGARVIQGFQGDNDQNVARQQWQGNQDFRSFGRSNKEQNRDMPAHLSRCLTALRWTRQHGLRVCAPHAQARHKHAHQFTWTGGWGPPGRPQLSAGPQFLRGEPPARGRRHQSAPQT